jgi:hypothetical protein
MEETDPCASSRLVPELTWPLKKHKNFDFLVKLTHCQFEEMVVEDINLMLTGHNDLPVQSPPFQVKHHGCNSCLHLALIQGKFSMGMAIMKGDRDKHIPWPFNMIVIFQLKNQSAGGQDEVKMFRCDKNGSRLKDSLMRPKASKNLPMGFPQFITQERLVEDGFVKNNTIIMRCYLFPKDAKIDLHPHYPSIIK